MKLSQSYDMVTLMISVCIFDRSGGGEIEVPPMSNIYVKTEVGKT